MSVAELVPQRGFSLIEVLLSMAMIAVLAGVSIPVYNTFAVRNDLDINAQHAANALRRAQTYARGVQGDSVWSVRVQTSAITLFKGTNFASRDTSFDEVISLPASATATGLSEVQFAKLTGIPNTTGSITLTSNSNETRTLTVNAKGVVGY